jgi:hypothetical protein
MNTKRTMKNGLATFVATAIACAAYGVPPGHSVAEHWNTPHSSAAHSSAPHSSAGHEASPLPERVAEAIWGYVRGIEETGAAFEVQDAGTGESVPLVLAAVDAYPLYRIGPDEYAAGAVFVSDAGATYVLDFDMKPATRELPNITRIHIRQVNGVPRYAWREKDGLWVREDIP